MAEVEEEKGGQGSKLLRHTRPLLSHSRFFLQLSHLTLAIHGKQLLSLAGLPKCPI